MRIVFFVDKFPAVSETFVLDQICGLIDRGHDVSIYAQSRGDFGDLHEDAKKYALSQRAYYKIGVPDCIFCRLIKGAGIFLKGLFCQPMVTLRCLNVFRYGKSAVSLRQLFSAAPHLGRGAYDIVQCHFGSNGIVASKLKRLGLLKGKIVTAFHAYDITKFPKIYGSDVYRELFEDGDLFQPISEDGKQKLMKLGCPEDKIAIHHMGVDLKEFRFRENRAKGNEQLLVLSVARLVEKKGIEYGIEAVANLSQRFANLKYVIVGDGPLKDVLEEKVRSMKLEGVVEFLGRKERAEVKELLEQAAVLLVPSVTAENGDQEGLPVVLMEAMASGVSVVSTFHAAIPELVEDGVSGYLAPERDVNVLAEKLAIVLERPDEQTEITKAARQRIEDAYEIEALNDALESVYCELAGV